MAAISTDINLEIVPVEWTCILLSNFWGYVNCSIQIVHRCLTQLLKPRASSNYYDKA